ncbi:response regulator [Paenibacillus polymyxa]|uniref:response regulator n=1 Tax=Paenibacillus polymyxa TaxID=1406 RepID=UPI003CC7CBEC
MKVKNVKKEGFLQVKHAATGQEALQVVMESHMDVIVLDVMLPDSDGFEVCRQMRLYTDAPILFLTARDTDLDKYLLSLKTTNTRIRVNQRS